MKRYLIIYKDKSDNKIRRVQIVPKIIKIDGKEKEVDSVFLDKFCTDYKSEYENPSYIEMPPELEEIIIFLQENRTRNINDHLKVLKEISDAISEIDNTVYSAIDSMKEDFKKQIEKEKREEE